MPRWKTGRIIRIQSVTSTTRRFWVQVDAEETVAFKPGQFITLDLPIAEKRNQRLRSYSIANNPDNTNILELCIVALEGGAASHYLFNEATEGTELTFKGPAGVFTLPETIQPEEELVLICTGTGVAPFRSMIRDLKVSNRLPHKLHLIFGTRYASGILYREEFENLAREEDWFDYSVSLSRDEQLSDLQVEFELTPGYVHRLVEEHYGTPAENRKFMICGWSAMVDEAAERLLNLGYQKNQIRFELYG